MILLVAKYLLLFVVICGAISATFLAVLGLGIGYNRLLDRLERWCDARAARTRQLDELAAAKLREEEIAALFREQLDAGTLHLYAGATAADLFSEGPK